MPEIVKLNALVLKKVDYSNSSKIATFFTAQMGKIAGIVKGGRSEKNKIGKVVDILNETELIFYFKENRDVQLISDANLVNHFHNIKEDLDALTYASSILELLEHFSMENEPQVRLYNGTIKILRLMNERTEDPLVLFLKYLLFFEEEVGFGINLSECAVCGKRLKPGDLGFNYELGFICNECKENQMVSLNFNAELFEDLLCLRSKDERKVYRVDNLKKILNMLERNLMFHAPNFTGIKSLKVFN